jgi:hypothetical protein
MADVESLADVLSIELSGLGLDARLHEVFEVVVRVKPRHAMVAAELADASELADAAEVTGTRQYSSRRYNHAERTRARRVDGA